MTPNGLGCLALLAAVCTVVAGCGGSTETIVVKAAPPTPTQTHPVTERAYRNNSAEPAQITACFWSDPKSQAEAQVRFPEESSVTATWRAEVDFGQGAPEAEPYADNSAGAVGIVNGNGHSTDCQIVSVEKWVDGKWQKVAGRGPAVPLQAGTAE